MTITIILAVIIISVMAFMAQPKFGRLPQGKRKDIITASANYAKGEFQNLSTTPSLAEDASFVGVFYKFFFKKSKRERPALPLPSVKNDLVNLGNDEDVLVWFGHSSYFIKADGKTFLADPVFSGHASPIKATTKAFKGSDIYSADDMPEIDVLFLSHDHWDHLDYDTVMQLKPKVQKVVTGLGTAEHLERWGFDLSIIEERNWNETIHLGDGFTVHTTPARHFSGRGLKRNNALWTSFVLKTPSYNLFLGGDSGYDIFFTEIGNNFGPFDLAILECGQYNEDWRYIHMLPEQVVQAAADLKTKLLLPVHWAKFSLALHDWDEPIKRVSAEAEKQNMPIATPMIGEKLNLKNTNITYSRWWQGLE